MSKIVFCLAFCIAFITCLFAIILQLHGGTFLFIWGLFTVGSSLLGLWASSSALYFEDNGNKKVIGSLLILSGLFLSLATSFYLSSIFTVMIVVVFFSSAYLIARPFNLDSDLK